MAEFERDRGMQALEPATDMAGPRAGLFIAYLVVFFVIWTVRATVLYQVDTWFHSALARQIYSNSVKLVLWVLPLFPYLRYIDKVDPLRYLRLSTPSTAAGLRFAAVATGLFLALVVIGATLLGQNVGALLAARWSEWLFALFASAFSPLWECILFRGFILHKLEERFSFWLANLLAALLFSAAHWPHWLWTIGLERTLNGAVSTLIIGCFLGYLVRKTNSLWPGVVAHIGNNLLASIILR